MMDDERLRWCCDCSNPIFEGEEVLAQDGALRCRCGRPLSGDPVPMTPDKVSSVSEEGLALKVLPWLRDDTPPDLRREITYASLRSSAPRTSEDAEWLRGLIPYLARHHFASEAIERIERIANTLDCSVK